MPPPPVANNDAQAILDTAYGPPPYGNPATRAGRAAKRASAARKLEYSGTVTTEELGQQESFAVEESLAAVLSGGAAALPPGAPAWAGAMLAHMNTQFANVNTQFANVNTQLGNLNNQLANVQAKQTNAVASEHTDPIVAITVLGTPVPAGFPATYGELLALNPGQSLPFLNYYGLQQNPQATCNIRLRKFLGAK